MKKICILCLFFFLLLGLLIFSAPTNAAGDCFTLNNGGVTTQQYCLSPTPANPNNGGNTFPQQTSPTPVPQQTTGGQRIYPASQSKTTPNTGPEEWSFLSLFLIGGLGFFLRNKAKRLT